MLRAGGVNALLCATITASTMRTGFEAPVLIFQQQTISLPQPQQEELLPVRWQEMWTCNENRGEPHQSKHIGETGLKRTLRASDAYPDWGQPSHQKFREHISATKKKELAYKIKPGKHIRACRQGLPNASLGNCPRVPMGRVT